MISYVNTETWELLTIEQLKDFYNDEGCTDTTFSHWIECCLTSNNGSLEEVERVTEWNIRAMVNDGYITPQVAEALMGLELYATKRGRFYSTDGRFFYCVNDLNSILE